MRISIRDNLPIHPRNARLADLIRILLDISIPCTSRQRISRRTVVVEGIEVTHPPLLHHQLLAGGLGFLHDGLEFGLGQVVETVGVDGDDVDCGAGEVGVFLHGGVDVRGAAGCDEDVGAALEVAFDGARDVALPFGESVGVFLLREGRVSWFISCIDGVGGSGFFTFPCMASFWVSKAKMYSGLCDHGFPL